MKRFIKETIIYLFLFGLFCFGVSYTIYNISDDGSYYRNYEVEMVNDKLNVLTNSEKKFNTVFFGTSKTYRHINPIVFDSILNGANSFNAGVSNLYPFRLHDFIRKVSATGNSKFKTVVIELAPLAQVGTNFDQNPNIFTIDFKRYLQALKYPFQNSYKTTSKISYVVGYSQLFFYKYFGFGIAKRIKLMGHIPSLENNDRLIDTDFISNKGYYSLDNQLKEKKGDDWKEIKYRNEDFNRKLSENSNFLNEEYFSKKSLSAFHEADDCTNDLLALIEVIRPVSEKIIFIIPPRVPKTDLHYLGKQKSFLLKSGFMVLDFSDPSSFPQLYEAGNSFDGSHLNDQGAKLYSSLLAREISNSIDNNEPLKALIQE